MDAPLRRAGWSPAGTAVRLTLLAVAYYGLARLGLLFASAGGLASPIWPPTGLAIAAVVLWGPRALPAVFLGAAAAELSVTQNGALAVLLGLGNSGEAALGGWLIRRAGGPRVFDSPAGVSRFAAAIALAPLVAATAGAVGLLAAGDVDLAGATQVWWTWYLGDAAGALVLAPVFLLLPGLRAGRLLGRQASETLAVVVLVVASAAMLFGLVPGIPVGHPALVVLLMPPIVWAAFRLGPGPAALTVLALDAMAVFVARQGQGPFGYVTGPDAYLVLQAFIFAIALMALGLAALATERRAAASVLETRVHDRTSDLEGLNAQLRREIAEKERAQAQVDEAQRAAHMGTWRWDISKPHAEWSPELFRIYGLDPAGHVPTYEDYLTRVHPDDRERVKAATDAVFRDHKVYSHDERVRRPDGTWRDLHTWASAVLGPDGKLAALVGACQDVTEQRRAERALQESLERFRALADASPIGIVHTRADGVVDYVNDKWRQITGVKDHTDREAMRRSVHPDDQPTLADLWRACVAEGREFDADMRFVHADGAVRWTRARAVPVRDGSGTLTGFVSALADITEQRQSEAKDREVRRLSEQAEFKTNFLRTAAHELGTPLTPIKIQMRILKGLIAASGREDERKAAEILDRNITRLHVLVQDMLESARIQSGRLRLDSRPIDFAHVVHDVVETFQEPAIQMGIALDTAGPNELPIVADPDRLSQVLYNLLSNAMKFTPAGGQIHVRVAPEGTDRVRVTVQDTGAGFPPEQVSQLFQPFMQLHDMSQRTRGGSGLGLYISKGIVEQHGGTMTGASEGPGKGATFSFVLPRVAVPYVPAAPAPEAQREKAPALAPPNQRPKAT
jgi:PAS domain S-box-containing protein